MLFFGTLHSNGYIFSLLLFASLLLTDICKASSDSHFAILNFFFLGMVLLPVSCHGLQSLVHQALCLSELGTQDPTETETELCLSIKRAREFQKNIYFCFIDYAKAFNCVDHSKLWKILKEMGIPDNMTCLLRNLYAGQEATVRTGHGTTD